MVRKQLTSQEACNRILWDSRLDREAFTIGYVDRLAPHGIRETPLSDWNPEGDIPWHRIRYILCGNEVVWDREQGIDRLSSADLPLEAWLGPHRR